MMRSQHFFEIVSITPTNGHGVSSGGLAVHRQHTRFQLEMVEEMINGLKATGK